MACLQVSFSSWLPPQKALTKVNFDELVQQLGSQISMWLSCLYSTEGMKEAGKRLKCYQHLSSGGRHSTLVLFVYSCSSHVFPLITMQFPQSFPWLWLALFLLSVEVQMPDLPSQICALFEKTPAPWHHVLSCGGVGLCDCASPAAIFSDKAPRRNHQATR